MNNNSAGSWKRVGGTLVGEYDEGGVRVSADVRMRSGRDGAKYCGSGRDAVKST
jgi:hypothetical protein